MVVVSLSRAADELVALLARAAAPARRVVLVVGPPTAGKSTLVGRLARKGDVVADFDAIARSLGSTAAGWDHPYPIRRQAEARMQELFDQIAGMESGRAWVVRSVPEATRREALAERLRADRVVLLKPPTDVLMRRALERPDSQGTRREIRRWLARYTPSRRDELAESDDVKF